MEKKGKQTKAQATTVTSSQQFNSRDIKQSYEKVQQQKKELSSLHKINPAKLNINISV